MHHSLTCKNNPTQQHIQIEYFSIPKTAHEPNNATGIENIPILN